MQFFNIEIQKGTSYELTLTFVDSVTYLPIDVSGWSCALNVRPDPSQPPAIALSSTAQNMVLGGAAGTVMAYFSPDQTVNASWKQAPFSLVLTPTSGSKILLIKGFVTVVDTPFAFINGTSSSAPSVSNSLVIPVDYAYYIQNTGPNTGNSASYFVSSGVDWGV